MAEPAARWEFAIDRGGTFTDCIGTAPDGSLHTAKILSSDTAAVDGIRAILARATGLPPDRPLPPCRLRMGTTVATNALLERRGVPTLLVTNTGLGDLIEIGSQQRPDLFDLKVVKPAPLQRAAIEVGGRVALSGEEIEELDEESAAAALAAARESGIDSLAIAMIHAYAHPDSERRLRALAERLGFAHVSVSHEVAREIGLLARGETTVVDAYLTPLLQSHVGDLAAALPDSQLRYMQSSGGLTDAARFRGPTALLSGPAGGVVGAASVATRAGFARAIGFDMGGTSTDVSFIADGDVLARPVPADGEARGLMISTSQAGGGDRLMLASQPISQDQTGPDGRFRVLLAEAGAVDLSVTAPGYAPADPSQDNRVEITLSRHDLVLEMRGAAKVTLRLRDAITGEPVFGGSLSLQSRISGQSGGGQDTMVVDNVPSGSPVMFIGSMAGSAPTWMEETLEPGDEIVRDLKLTRGGTLLLRVPEGTLRQDDPWSFEGDLHLVSNGQDLMGYRFSDALAKNAKETAPGEWRFDNLPEGQLRVSLGQGDTAVGTTVAIREGVPAEADLRP